MVEDPITPNELKIAKQGAMSAYRSGRGIVSAEDMVGEANLWLVKHIDKVRLWRDQGRHGRTNCVTHAVNAASPSSLTNVRSSPVCSLVTSSTTRQ